jgi:hypothetical protein
VVEEGPIPLPDDQLPAIIEPLPPARATKPGRASRIPALSGCRMAKSGMTVDVRFKCLIGWFIFVGEFMGGLDAG